MTSRTMGHSWRMSMATAGLGATRAICLEAPGVAGVRDADVGSRRRGHTRPRSISRFISIRPRHPKTLCCGDLLICQVGIVHNGIEDPSILCRGVFYVVLPCAVHAARGKLPAQRRIQ